MGRIELPTSPLPRECSTTEPHGQYCTTTFKLERVAGIEPASSAWKAEVLPLNYTRIQPQRGRKACPTARKLNLQQTARSTQNYATLVEGEGFEPSKAEPSDLQSDPFDRSGTPPEESAIILRHPHPVNTFIEIFSRLRPGE